MNKNLGIPTGWIKTELGEVLDYGKAEKVEPSQIPLDAWILELEDIEKDTSDLLQRITFTQRQSKSTKNRFHKGDVLYSRLRPYLNKVLIADQDGYSTTEIIPLKSNEAVYGPFLFYWLKHPAFLKYVNSVSYGINMPRLGTEGGLQAPLTLAPFNEQKRIADKLDTLLVRINECQTRLEHVRLILNRFRQSVLVAATSGRLTEKWREKREHPFNWQSVKLSDIGEIGRGKSKHRPRNDSRLYGGPYPFIQTGDIAEAGEYIKMHSQTYNEFGLSQSRLWPAETLCITIAANIAKTAILSYPTCFPDSVVGFIANPQQSLPQFVKWNIDLRHDELEAYAPATAQKNINLAILNEIRFNCPPIDEQHEIVRRVEKLFDLADRIEAHYQAAQAQIDHLTPALLSKAFRGELVPQDPNDEPASVLLERIRRTRANAATQTKKTSQRSDMQKKNPNPKKSSNPIQVVQTLREAGRELSGDALFVAAGYPSDADPDLIEAFFVDIRQALQDNTISRVRRDDVDWFSLVNEKANYED